MVPALEPASSGWWNRLLIKVNILERKENAGKKLSFDEFILHFYFRKSRRKAFHSP